MGAGSVQDLEPPAHGSVAQCPLAQPAQRLWGHRHDLQAVTGRARVRFVQQDLLGTGYEAQRSRDGDSAGQGGRQSAQSAWRWWSQYYQRHAGAGVAEDHGEDRAERDARQHHRFLRSARRLLAGSVGDDQGRYSASARHVHEGALAHLHSPQEFLARGPALH